MMLMEAAAALLLGLGVLWLVFQPLLEPPSREPEFVEPADLEETPRGQALLALKEIEFDLETGKLSEDDYHDLKARYTALALEAMRAEELAAPAAGADVEALIASRVAALQTGGGTLTATRAPTCPTCGPRPEEDALWCSHCGGALPGAPVCGTCRAPLEPSAAFCSDCGAARPS
jgi:hypothetical protein